MKPTGASAGEAAARYEELRCQVLDGTGRGCGLIVFLRHGMRAWMEASGPGTATAAPACDSAALPLPQAQAEIVLLLAGMALSHGKEQPC